MVNYTPDKCHILAILDILSKVKVKIKTAGITVLKKEQAFRLFTK